MKSSLIIIFFYLKFKLKFLLKIIKFIINAINDLLIFIYLYISRKGIMFWEDITIRDGGRPHSWPFAWDSLREKIKYKNKSRVSFANLWWN